MKKGERKTPDIYFDPMLRFTPEEKAKLRSVLTDPIYIKWMRIVEGKKPSSNCALAGTGSRDAFSNDRANARLGEIRGWELHTAAMFWALSDSPPPRMETEASYPMSATLNLEPRIAK